MTDVTWADHLAQLDFFVKSPVLLDAWAGRLRAVGVPVLFDDGFPGMRRFYSEDPLGNRLEFLEPVDEG